MQCPWFLADTVEEVRDLSKVLAASSTYIERSPSLEADILTKEGVTRSRVSIVSHLGGVGVFFVCG